MWRYRADSGAALKGQMVYEEPDEAFSLGLGITRSRRFVTLFGGSDATTYLMILDAAQAGWCGEPPLALPCALRVTTLPGVTFRVGSQKFHVGRGENMVDIDRVADQRAPESGLTPPFMCC